MRIDRQLALLDRLLAVVTQGEPAGESRESRLEVERYTSTARLEAERQVLFRELPIVVGRESDLPEVGSFFTHDAAGLPLLVTRSEGGRVHVMLNVCSHRGSRLVCEARGSASGFVCPYHAWSYDLSGALSHVPAPRSFPTLRRDERALPELPVELRHGFIWASLSRRRGARLDVRSWLGDFDDDLAGFGLDRHAVFRRRETTRAANWKLAIDALLDGLHGAKAAAARRVNRDEAIADVAGPHVRVVGARKNLPEIANHGRDQWDLRRYATLSYALFPNALLVFHADAISHLAVFPETIDTSTFVHTMLVPEAPRTAEARARLERAWDALDGDLYSAQDLAHAESVQASIQAYAFDAFRLGTLEQRIRAFHDTIDRTISEHRL